MDVRMMQANTWRTKNDGKCHEGKERDSVRENDGIGVGDPGNR